jgi:RHS repeat-associated protein
LRFGLRDDEYQYGYETVYVTVKRPKHFYFYVKDHLGSTRAVVDEAGDVVEAYDYYPFGLQSRSYKEKGDPLTKETFTGKEQDTESNLHYFGARYYDAGAGRFLSTDAFSEKYLGLNPFHYAANNPLYFTDVNGDSVEWHDEDLKKRHDELYEKSKKYREAYDKLAGSKVWFHIMTISQAQKKGLEVKSTSDGQVGTTDGLSLILAVSLVGSQKGNLAHEVKHGEQFEDGDLYFNDADGDGVWSSNNSQELEREAHQFEYDVTGNKRNGWSNDYGNQQEALSRGGYLGLKPKTGPSYSTSITIKTLMNATNGHIFGYKLPHPSVAK